MAFLRHFSKSTQGRIAPIFLREKPEITSEDNHFWHFVLTNCLVVVTYPAESVKGWQQKHLTGLPTMTGSHVGECKSVRQLRAGRDEDVKLFTRSRVDDMMQ